jgi:predicted Zn-dependent peptidase
MPHTRSVSLGFFIGTGSRYETAAQSGISHFNEHLCFRGTEKRPTHADICTAVEGVGGILNAGTDKELTVYWSKVAQPHFATALDVLTDMIVNSRFDPEDVEKERQIITEEINMCLDSPSQRVAMLIDEILWPEHPLGRDIAGSKESVAGINRKMMLDYLGRRYRPGNTVLSVAGDIKHEEVVDIVTRATTGWVGNCPPGAGYQPYEEKMTCRQIIENRDTEQAHLCLALPGLSITAPERFKLDLLNTILGEGMSSRLFMEIRDKLGLAYSIHSFVEHLLDTGSITVTAGVDPEYLSVAIKAILEELGRMKSTVTPEPELVKAKELSKGRLLLRFEDSRSVAGWMGGQEILTGEIISVEEVVSIIDAITAEDVQQMAERMLVGEKLRLAVVGPISEEESLEDLLKL